jgi:hypothetical protein
VQWDEQREGRTAGVGREGGGGGLPLADGTGASRVEPRHEGPRSLDVDLVFFQLGPSCRRRRLLGGVPRARLAEEGPVHVLPALVLLCLPVEGSLLQPLSPELLRGHLGLRRTGGLLRSLLLAPHLVVGPRPPLLLLLLPMAVGAMLLLRRRRRLPLLGKGHSGECLAPLLLFCGVPLLLLHALFSKNKMKK